MYSAPVFIGELHEQNSVSNTVINDPLPVNPKLPLQFALRIYYDVNICTRNCMFIL